MAHGIAYLHALVLAATIPSTRSVLTAAGIVTLTAILRKVLRYYLRTRSPLRRLPGPPGGLSPLFGHLRDMMSAEDNCVLHDWNDKYGGTFGMKGFFGKWCLVTTDPRALAHVLHTTDVYYKPEQTRKGFGRFLGKGVLFSEGPVFFQKAHELGDIWANQCVDNPTTQIDVLDWLSRATLDVIGLAGFAHTFDSLHLPKDELALAVQDLFKADLTIWDQFHMLLNNSVPGKKRFWPGPRAKELAKSKLQMDKIAATMAQEKKVAVLAALQNPVANSNDRNDAEALEGRARFGRDIISVLVKANMDAGLADDKRLTDEEVRAQIPTFLVADHETTAHALSWTLYALSQNPEVQTALRTELGRATTDYTNAQAFDELNSLPLLDAVVRESLRIYPPVGFTMRQAMTDDMIPLAQTVHLRSGELVDSLRIQKGDIVSVPISLINTSPEIWGPDAQEFNPSRWLRPPLAATTSPTTGAEEHQAPSAALPSIIPHIITFLGGPRACIGHRFAQGEIKVFLAHIVTRFRLDVDETEEVWTRSAVVRRPLVRSTGKPGMLLVLRLVSNDPVV